MKNPIPLLIGCLLCWICIGTCLYRQSCCEINTNLSILDGKTTVAAMTGNILCNYSNDKVEMTESVRNGMAQVSTYLKEHPNRVLYLTGNYQKDEKNETDVENIGLARAKFIRNLLWSNGADSSQVIIAGVANEALQFDNDKCNGCVDYNFQERSINIQDDAKFSASESDNLMFHESNHQHIKPIAASLTAVYQKTADYLKANPNRALRITGVYGSKEENKSLLSDLGLARAADIKSILMGLGVSAKQLEIQSKLEENVGDMVVGGAVYAFEDKSEVEAAADMRGKSIILYFESNQNNIELTKEQQSFFSQAITYLDQNPKANIVSTGHTDNAGSRPYNIKLAQERADFVKSYLAQNGLNPNQLKSSSKGPDVPIADNATPEGKAKNRRVEISIK